MKNIHNSLLATRPYLKYETRGRFGKIGSTDKYTVITIRKQQARSTRITYGNTRYIETNVSISSVRLFQDIRAMKCKNEKANETPTQPPAPHNTTRTPKLYN